MNVAIYVRVSTAQQTTENQLIELREVCERNNWNVVEIYNETVSGTKGQHDREELNRMMIDASRKKFSKVAVWSVDRLGRNMKHLVSVLSQLKDLDVELYSYKQGIDTSTTMGQSFFYMVGIFSELENYFKDQKELISHLSPTIKKKLTIKLHPKFHNKVFQEDIRWFEFDPSLMIETKKVSVNYLISRSRLVLHAYDSTGILDTLTRNIPTIAFWQNGFDHLREKIIPDYQKLVDAGIVHLSPQSTAKKINEIWDDVDGWWEKKQTQEARKNFCDKYAKNCDNPARKMASLLREK